MSCKVEKRWERSPYQDFRLCIFLHLPVPFQAGRGLDIDIDKAADISVVNTSMLLSVTMVSIVQMEVAFTKSLSVDEAVMQLDQLVRRVVQCSVDGGREPGCTVRYLALN